MYCCSSTRKMSWDLYAPFKMKNCLMATEARGRNKSCSLKGKKRIFPSISGSSIWLKSFVLLV